MKCWFPSQWHSKASILYWISQNKPVTASKMRCKTVASAFVLADGQNAMRLYHNWLCQKEPRFWHFFEKLLITWMGHVVMSWLLRGDDCLGPAEAGTCALSPRSSERSQGRKDLGEASVGEVGLYPRPSPSLSPPSPSSPAWPCGQHPPGDSSMTRGPSLGDRRPWQLASADMDRCISDPRDWYIWNINTPRN